MRKDRERRKILQALTVDKAFVTKHTDNELVRYYLTHMTQQAIAANHLTRLEITIKQYRVLKYTFYNFRRIF